MYWVASLDFTPRLLDISLPLVCAHIDRVHVHDMRASDGVRRAPRDSDVRTTVKAFARVEPRLRAVVGEDVRQKAIGGVLVDGVFVPIGMYLTCVPSIY